MYRKPIAVEVWSRGRRCVVSLPSRCWRNVLPYKSNTKKRNCKRWFSFLDIIFAVRQKNRNFAWKRPCGAFGREMA